MNAIVAEPFGIEAGKKDRDLKYVQKLSECLLVELADELNKFHDTQYSIRYWQILLGNWLQRFIAVAFNRYFTIAKALENYKVSGTTVFESVGYSLATTNSMSFIRACSDDVWNHNFYAKVLGFFGDTKVEIDSVPLPKMSGFAQTMDEKIVPKASLKRLIGNVARFVLPSLSRKNDAFIINSYLPLKEEIILQLSLGQCPQVWRSPKLKTISPATDIRQSFGVDAEKHQGFERFVRIMLAEVIPTCYLEGYNQLIEQVESLPWPVSPRFILTSNNFDTDEIFKAWTSSKVDMGVPYYVGQHGGSYGTYLGCPDMPELLTCDRFLTWGWSEYLNTVPAFNFKISSLKPAGYDADGGLLLIELHEPDPVLVWDVYYEFGVYQQEQFRFVEALPESIQQQLKIRLHPACSKFRWSDEQRWKEHSPHVRIESGAATIRALTAQSRLVVHSYDSTGILETLALNIPTICFWHGGLGHLLPTAKPYYESLRSAGIIADTAEQAAEMVGLHWDDISGWWNSQPVQDARKAFCDKYSRKEKHPVRTMRRLLTSHAKNRGKLP